MILAFAVIGFVTGAVAAALVLATTRSHPECPLPHYIALPPTTVDRWRDAPPGHKWRYQFDSLGNFIAAELIVDWHAPSPGSLYIEHLDIGDPPPRWLLGEADYHLEKLGI